MREGGKINIWEKNIKPIFGKVNEGEKKKLDKLLGNLMRATK